MNNVLVAYFTTGNVTGKLAEKLARAVKGDLFAIVPAVPYSKADLNWNDPPLPQLSGNARQDFPPRYCL